MEVLKDNLTSGLSDLGTTIIEGFKDTLTTLFVPTFSPIDELKKLLDSKLPILEQLFQILKNAVGDTSEDAPTFSITYKGQKHNIVDFSVFTPYRPALFIIQNAIYWYLCIKWLIKFIPSMLSGIGGVSK